MLNQCGLIKFLTHSEKPVAKTLKLWLESLHTKVVELTAAEEQVNVLKAFAQNRRQELTQEQIQMQREWILNKLPQKYQELLANIENPMDLSEIITKWLRQCGIKNIVMVPEYEEDLDEWTYVP